MTEQHLTAIADMVAERVVHGMYSTMPIFRMNYMLNSTMQGSENFCVNIENSTPDDLDAKITSIKEEVTMYLKNGYGSIYPKSKTDPRLVGRYQIAELDKRGKPKSKQTGIQRKGENIKEFVARHHKWVDGYRVKLTTGPPAPETITLYSAIDKYFELELYENIRTGRHREKGKRSKTTVSKYENAYRHIRAHYADKPLDGKDGEKLTPLDLVQGSINVMKKPISDKFKYSRTREDVDGLIYQALLWAYIMKLTKENHVAFMVKKKYKHEREQGRAFSMADQVRILEYAKVHSKYYMAYMFYFWTGARPGELLEVRHCDINFFKGTIFIDGTKTRTSTRTIPLFKPLFEFRDDIISGSKEKIVTVSTNSLRTDLKKILLSLGIAGEDEISVDEDEDDSKTKYTLKSTRHSFVTRRMEDGTPVKAISKWTGHSTPTMTDHYSHILDDFELLLAEKVNTIASMAA